MREVLEANQWSTRRQYGIKACKQMVNFHTRSTKNILTPPACMVVVRRRLIWSFPDRTWHASMAISWIKKHEPATTPASARSQAIREESPYQLGQLTGSSPVDTTRSHSNYLDKSIVWSHIVYKKSRPLKKVWQANTRSGLPWFAKLYVSLLQKEI